MHYLRTKAWHLRRLHDLRQRQRGFIINPYSYATAGGGTDPMFASVISLLHFDGADNSTTFTDVTGKVWTRNSTPVIRTIQSVFGGASGEFIGGGSLEYIYTPTHADWLFGSGDFCVEGRIWNGSSTTNGIFEISHTGGTVSPFIVYQSTNNIHFYCSSNGSSWDIASGYVVGTGMSASTWYAYRIDRSGSTWSMYFDGTRTNQFTSSASIYASNPGDVRLGVYNPSGGSSWDGYMDEFRATRASRSTGASYTLDAAAFPDS